MYLDLFENISFFCRVKDIVTSNFKEMKNNKITKTLLKKLQNAQKYICNYINYCCDYFYRCIDGQCYPDASKCIRVSCGHKQIMVLSITLMIFSFHSDQDFLLKQ